MLNPVLPAPFVQNTLAKSCFPPCKGFGSNNLRIGGNIVGPGSLYAEALLAVPCLPCNLLAVLTTKPDVLTSCMHGIYLISVKS